MKAAGSPLAARRDGSQHVHKRQQVPDVPGAGREVKAGGRHGYSLLRPAVGYGQCRQGSRTVRPVPWLSAQHAAPYGNSLHFRSHHALTARRPH